MLRELREFGHMWPRLRWRREQLIAYRECKLRALLAHAYANVLHYRRLFDRVGAKPGDIRSAEDLSRIPTTTKDDIQSSPPEDFVARGLDPKRLILRMSGGSTGEPKPIRRTWFEERLLNAFRFRARRCVGLRATDVIASIGLSRGRQRADRQLPSRLAGRLGLFREVKVNCLSPPDEIVRKLSDIRPDVITGYASAVAQAAQAMQDRGVTSVRPRFVTTGAEVQTPLMRQQIGEAFGCPVYNFYGANEFNLLAWECAETGELHACDDLVVLEVLRDGDRPARVGERGEVVGTNLHAWAMPFIRFRIDDVVTRGGAQCACGMPFSTIRAVQGRMLDYFPLPDGRMMHPYEIIDVVLHDRATWSRRYQLVQERRDLVILRAVLKRTPSQQRINEIHEGARRALGAGVEFRVEFVDQIPCEANGKFRAFRSFVQSRYDGFDWERVADAR
jgi:phenylacetate-CoA ligase